MSTAIHCARRAPHSFPPLATLALLAVSCAAPERSPLTAERVMLELSERDVSPEALAAIVERAGLEPLALGPLPEPGAELDLDAAPFWRASALAYAPEVRAARRALAAAHERDASAGRPGSIDALVETEDLGDPSPGRAVISVDLIGFLGLGPAASARELSRAEVRAARARLEIVAWEARVEVDRARAGLAVVRAERAALRELAHDGAFTWRRAVLLDEHGRVSEEALAMARLAEHHLLRRLSALEADEALARATLARAAGLPADASELDGVTGATLAQLAASAGSTNVPARRELFTQSPRLRGALVEYAVAEARLFDEAAARWPELRAGPHLLWRMDEFLVGAAVEAATPWPGALEGRVRAAHEEREAAREAAEDLLLEEEARARAASERLLLTRAAIEQHAAPAERDAAQLLRATAARFAVEPAALAEWAQALRMRMEVLEALFATRQDEIGAALDLERACGPRTSDAPALDQGAQKEVRA